MQHFATIITASHNGYARVLLGSLRKHASEEVRLHVLIVDDERGGTRAQDPPGFVRHHIGGLADDPWLAAIVERDADSNLDALRWSLKPIFLSYLLASEAASAVAYVDSDQYFVGDPGILFEFDPETRLRLSPHWRPIDPGEGGVFHEQFVDGIFNGGLLVAKKGSNDILSWWASACAYRCEKAPEEGLFVDQKYLDVVPVYFEGVDIIRHKGINVARWNRRYLERSVDADGRILVEHDPLICVHFSPNTIRAIEQGKDPLLEPVLGDYRRDLRREGIRLNSTKADQQHADEYQVSSLTAFFRSGIRKAGRIVRAVHSAVQDAW